MLEEFEVAMTEHGILLKPRECKWFGNKAAWEESGTESYSVRVEKTAALGSKVGYGMDEVSIDLPFDMEPSIEILGARLTPNADGDIAVKFALARGRKHWMQRRIQLCRCRVLLSKRIRRLHNCWQISPSWA